MPFNWSSKGRSSSENPPPTPPGDPASSAASVPPPAEPAPLASAIAISAPGRILMEREGASVRLPKITLSPISYDHPPEITAVSVVGHSSMKGFGEWLTQAYAAGCAKVPRKLNKEIAIEAGRADWPYSQPLPGAQSGALHSLTIQVEHRPIGPDGRVGSAKAIATANVQLLVGESLQPTAELRVMPNKLLKVYEVGSRGVGPQLVIRLVNNRPSAATANTKPQRGTVELRPTIGLSAPDLALSAAEWGCPNLPSAIDAMLRTIESKIQTTENGLLIRAIPRFRLDATERAAISQRLRKNNSTSLLLPIRIEAAGAPPLMMEFELNPQTAIQEGLIVFDLGTSTSVACRYDPKSIERSVFPREQLTQLNQDFRQFLNNYGKEIPEAESYWNKLLQSTATQCGLGTEGDPIQALLRKLDFPLNSERGAEEFYEMIRNLELQLWTLTAASPAQDDRRKLLRFQEQIGQKLHGFYGRAFEKLPLAQWNISMGQPESEGSPLLVSELELFDLEPLPTGKLSKKSAERRLDWLSGKEPEPKGSVRSGRFLECPKRFLPHIHEEVALTEYDAWPVTVMSAEGEKTETLTARQALQASWNCLIESAAVERRAGDRGIDQVAATYPADLMPEPRSHLDQALRELGMVTVHLDFDESISPAIFHLEQLFGNMEEIGCEAFKIQCVREGNLWTHHMLVLDIGAGTTDISLIRLEMRERLPDKSEYGGRLYEITPKLLGAAGRSQSGGHQLTLKLFRVLKLAIANWIQAAISEDGTKNSDRARLPFRDAESGDDAGNQTILSRAEEALPTRFHELYKLLKAEKTVSTDLADARRRLERFTLLWKWAEELKIHISEMILRTSREELPKSIPFDDVFASAGSTRLKETLENLLKETRYEQYVSEILNSSTQPMPRISLDDFRQLAQTSVERSVKLATSMAKSALEKYSKLPDVGNNIKLQSVVLSGRACALPEVQSLLRRELGSERLGGGKAKILFRSEYAKTATAIGACRAQRRIASAKSYGDSIPNLEGKCEMDIRIKNLFFYLPASYRIGTASNELGSSILERQTEFRQHGTAPLGIIRSGNNQLDSTPQATCFETPSREVQIFRDDGDGSGLLQGRLVVRDLFGERQLPNRNLAMECTTWRVRYEIDHRRKLAALLIRPIPGASASQDTYEPVFDLETPSEAPNTVVPLDQKATKALLAAASDHCPFHIFLRPPVANAQSFVSDHQMVPIACKAVPVEGVANAPAIVRAWLSPVKSESELAIPRDGRITFYLVNPKTGKEVQTITVEPKPIDPDNPENSPVEFPFSVVYRIAITADGRFAILIGDEPKYWETTDIEEWLISPEGRILRYELKAPRHDLNAWREPFCGEH